METLESLAQQNQNWTLDQFVEIINRLLPNYLPIVKANPRVREEINPRLVRHYTSQGLLDEPHKQGKYAYYTYRHLLQILVIRRLGSEGVSSATMGQFIPNKNNTELENLLNGGTQIQINPANPALAFLQSVKSRPHTTRSSISLQSNQFSDFTPFEQNLWTHIEIVPGLEVHLHSDFSYPDSPNTREFLKQQILQALEEYIKHKQGKI